MKNTLIFALLLISFNASAQDDCTLSPEAIKSVLKGGKVERQKHGLKEWLKLKDFKVTYEMGGCAHYAYSFTFEDFGKADLLSADNILKLSEKMLKETPVTSSENLDRFLRSIKEAQSAKTKMNNQVLPLPCGDAFCEINLSEKSKLKISYDFAL